MSDDLHIPGGEVKFDFPQQATIVAGEYIPEHRLNGGEIRAGMAAGELQPWRYDESGVLWYRRITGAESSMPVIDGTPIEPAIAKQPEEVEVEMIEAEDSPE